MKSFHFALVAFLTLSISKISHSNERQLLSCQVAESNGKQAGINLSLEENSFGSGTVSITSYPDTGSITGFEGDYYTYSQEKIKELKLPAPAFKILKIKKTDIAQATVYFANEFPHREHGDLLIYALYKKDAKSGELKYVGSYGSLRGSTLVCDYK